MLNLPPLKILMPGAGGYVIEGSANFADAGANHHNWTPAGTGDSRTVMTVEAVFKLFSLATDQHIFTASDGAGNNVERLYIDATGNLHYEIIVGGSTVVHYETTALFRDYSAWYQVVVIRNGNTVTLYVNGTAVAAFDTSDAPTGDNGMFGHTEAHYIGRKPWTTSGYLDLAIARLTYQDGVAASISDYGEAVGNGWSIADASSLSLGTNGVQITGGTDMAAGTLTRSGTAHSVTKTGTITATNDSPTNDATNGYGNRAVVNPLYYYPTAGRLTLSNGNRSWAANDASYWQNAALTISVTSGKYIIACDMPDLGAGSMAHGIGISTVASFTPGTAGNAFPGGADFGSDSCSIYDRSGVDPTEVVVASGGTVTATGYNFASGDQMIVALDADDGKAWVGWWDDSASTLYWFDSSGTRRSSDEPGSGTNATMTYTAGTQMLFCAFGIVTPSSASTLLEEADWSFTKPTGFLELSTENLPAPAITDPSAYFKAVTYTTTGSDGLQVTGFTDAGGNDVTPDFVWQKNRDQTDRHLIYDVLRGAGNRLSSNLTQAEASESDTLKTFDAGGVTLGNDATNALGINHTASESCIMWMLKAGGAGSANTDGSISSTVSVADHSGFAIINSNVGATSSGTIGHGMGQAPEMIIGKPRDNTYSWGVYHKDIGETKALFLESTSAAIPRAMWNNTAPTSSVFSFGNSDWINNCIFYAFARTSGLIGIGSYTGNGDADGPYVVVDDGASGFKPAFVLIKNIDDSQDWVMFDNARDPYNVVDANLSPNLPNEEDAGTSLDFTANGFKPRAVSDINNSSKTYIYLALAEYPFGGDGVEQARAR